MLQGELPTAGPALGVQASLAKEAKGTGVTVHLASPGMVATDLLAASVAHNPRVAWILNILAEEPRKVARWLAPRMRVCSEQAPSKHDLSHVQSVLLVVVVLRVTTEHMLWLFRAMSSFTEEQQQQMGGCGALQGVKGNGTYFKYLTPLGALWRFATAWQRRGRFYPTKQPATSGNTAGAQEPLLKQRKSDTQ